MRSISSYRFPMAHQHTIELPSAALPRHSYSTMVTSRCAVPAAGAAGSGVPLWSDGPPTANNGYAPWDIDHPRHGKMLDYCMEHLHGYTHPAMNTANWIGKWAGLLNYDPLHSDNNTSKPLWHIIYHRHARHERSYFFTSWHVRTCTA